MSLFNKCLTRKLINSGYIIFHMYFFTGKIHLDHQTRNDFTKLSEKNISKILIYEMSTYTKDDYVISSKK
jgi:hypothetical protein